jgi:hypothetical protein
MGAVDRRYQRKYKVGGITFDDNSISFKGVKDRRDETEAIATLKMLLKGKRLAGIRRLKR